MIISGTGHRPNKLEVHGIQAYPDSFAYDRLVSLSMAILDAEKADKVISGMALGFDMALAQAAIYLKTPFVAAIPFVGQEKQWPEKSQAYYRNLLEQADEIAEVSPPGYEAKKMHIRNEWMVNHTDKVIALWNGNTSGGTASCVKYAESTNTEIVNYWSVWEKHKGHIPFLDTEECVLDYYGIKFLSLANFIKAVEYPDERIRRHIATIDPDKVREFAEKKDRKRGNIKQIYYDAVLYGAREKYKQNPELATRLVASYPKPIYHWAADKQYDPVKDIRIKNGAGDNMLGKILEVVRNELREQ